MCALQTFHSICQRRDGPSGRPAYRVDFAFGRSMPLSTSWCIPARLSFPEIKAGPRYGALSGLEPMEATAPPTGTWVGLTKDQGRRCDLDGKIWHRVICC